MERIISMNIVYTYPVQWTRYQVMRDFIQNFYDAVRPEQWYSFFHYVYDDDQRELTMEIHDEGFSYEWLLHIGASTKTDSDDLHAGYFGEGFKIASLCAVRDYGWIVTMCSRDWNLKVLTQDEEIDHNKVKILAYKLTDSDYLHGSRLVVGNFGIDDYSMFLSILDGFYYPENPLFGKMIWEGAQGAIYERSSVPINEYLPQTIDCGSTGAVFCSYQMLGTIPLPLVFCLHNYDKLDRDRRTLHKFEVIDVMLKLFPLISPAAAVIVLEKMRRYWYSCPNKKKKVDVENWGSTVNALIRMIRYSDKEVMVFRSKYPNLLCASVTRTGYEKNRRRQALTWLKLDRPGYIIVKGTFCLLGYPYLEDECEAAGGYVKSNRPPGNTEKECFEILEMFVKEAFDGFFDFGDTWPDLEIITNSSAAFKGMASLLKRRDAKINTAGLKYKYNLYKVHLKEYLFHDNCFDEALSTYIHELCHVFGGDSSACFSHALTIAMSKLIISHDNVMRTKKDWTEIFQIKHCTAKVI